MSKLPFFNWQTPAKYDDDLGPDISQEIMMELAWTEKLSVGNAIIDSEHRNLIGIVNDVSLGIKTRDGSSLSQAFKLLEHWLCTHFANEEKIAQAVNFPFAQHKLAQQHSLKELQYMRDELEAKDGMWSDSAVEHFTRSLKNWMIDRHIVNLDMQMKPVLQNHDYNFWPG
ncbi:MAG TPA: hemerythrin domain-containing protein [Gallionella sp.]|nr:hemerythrin domain-containing protein [Gallionella sp.]